MHALGVPTTRALSLVVSDSMVVNRGNFEPCAITCRAARSFIRVGSFELFGKRIVDAPERFPSARKELVQLVQV